MNLVKTCVILFFLSVATIVSAAEVVSIKEAVKKNPDIKYYKVRESECLKFKPFPLSSSLNKTWENPIIPETFVVYIPKGKVYSKDGVVIVDNNLIEELIWPWSKIKKDPESFSIKKLSSPKYISGRVMVLAQEGSRNYYHWVTEVLPKFELLEKADIKYDWIYLPGKLSGFMKETLAMFGVDSRKIICAEKDSFIEAEELIAPSFVSRSCYTPPWVASYMREKLLPLVLSDKSTDFKNLPKKIFISRNKAPHRRIINENEIREKLVAKGFVTVNLEDLSVKKQIALFNNAEMIVASHGAGLTNLLFAKPKTKVIEIFQAHEDDTYWYLSRVLDLDHHCIKTVPFEKNGGYKNTEVFWEMLDKKIDAILTATIGSVQEL